MDPAAIREQITRVLCSRTFAHKSQVRRLLEILFQNMDSEVQLKPNDVIKQVWPDETRTKRAADVATEISRLRRALDAYYEKEGASDPITVYLPNRSSNAADGAQETRWIAAKIRRPLESGSEVAIATEIPSTKTNLKTAITIAALLVLAIMGYFSIRILRGQAQPQSGRLEGMTLRIFDASGKELWSKNFPQGFGPDWYYDEKMWGSHIWFADLDGKGHTSVLFSYSAAGDRMSPRSSILICYSDRGQEKWRWVPGRDLPELNGSSATYMTHALKILKATEKRPVRILVASQHQPWWPSQLAVLDSNGKTVSEYWHSGGLDFITLADLDGNGREEIIATGVANGYDHQADLVVLDPDKVTGASSEVRPEFQIHGMGAAHERLRLLFPRSDLNRALYQYNVAMHPTFENGILRLTVAECTTPTYGCPIWYEFDRHFHLIAAYAGGDELRSAHNRFYQTGKKPHALSAEEQSAFQKVRCLVGCQSDYVPVGNLVP